MSDDEQSEQVTLKVASFFYPSTQSMFVIPWNHVISELNLVVTIKIYDGSNKWIYY